MCKRAIAGWSRGAARALLGLAVATVPALLFAQAPGQVSGLIWCPGTKDCLAWSAANGATEYRLYRGSLGSLPDLLNPNADSCRVASYTATTTQGVLSDTPTRCGIFWYLVTGANGAGEGPAGDATGGPRVLDAQGVQCKATCTAEGNLCTASGACCSGDCQGGCVLACSDPSPCGFYMSKCSGACTNTATDPANCGGCGAACSSNHVTPQCSSATCNGICATGFADCDGTLRVDGCEVNIFSDPNSCGGCAVVCSFNNMQTRTCGGGTCNGTCAFGFTDCNGNKLTDGCESNLTTDPNNCGGCGAVCSANHMASRFCGGGTCGGTCATGFADCNGNKRTDGCEINLNTDPNNCSGCGVSCSFSGIATRTCGGGTCNGACLTGFADCDGNKRTNGCEIDVTSDPNNCGGCGVSCSGNGMTTRTCGGGACNGICAAGLADCNNNKLTDGCEIDINTNLNNCSGCGLACSSNHMATLSCSGGICNGTCASGFEDCNGNKRTDGCEININTDLGNCGGCGATCSTNHMATLSCSGGICNGTCASGFADCNGNKRTDGCEININTNPNNCSGCGIVCSSSGMATRTCGGGTCNGTCSAGLADCNGNKQTDGCESNSSTDPNNCGSCGNACPPLTPICLGGMCH